MARKPIGTKLRFDVFKRDGFLCVYCGAPPTTVTLEIDHVIPVADGGSNSIDNLVTACWSCNSGKGARPLSAIPQSLKEKNALMKERAKQVASYSALVAEVERLISEQIDSVVAIFEDSENGFTLTGSARQSVRHFVDKLGVLKAQEAMRMACGRKHKHPGLFKYFCGICWNWIGDLG